MDSASEVGEQWLIGGGGTEDCEALCKSAGITLARSPRSAAHLSKQLRENRDDTDRWLDFIRSRGLIKIDETPYPNLPTVQTGTIRDLANVSARLCQELAANEL